MLESNWPMREHNISHVAVSTKLYGVKDHCLVKSIQYYQKTWILRESENSEFHMKSQNINQETTRNI